MAVFVESQYKERAANATYNSAQIATQNSNSYWSTAQFRALSSTVSRPELHIPIRYKEVIVIP